MAPKLTWGSNKRAATVLGCFESNADLNSKTSAQTVLSDVSKDSNAVIFGVKSVEKQLDDGTTNRQILLAQRHGFASHRTGIFHFSPLPFGQRNGNTSASQMFPKRPHVSSQTMLLTLYSHFIHCKVLRPVASSPQPLT